MLAEEMVLLATFWLMLSAMDTAERPLLLLKMLSCTSSVIDPAPFRCSMMPPLLLKISLP
ncbi:hypothetical protein D3C71_1892790 [compost metagenome]